MNNPKNFAEMNVLEKINSPADLKKLNAKELPQLCQELRNKIIETVAKNGGHLASNLGTVELTVALHYIFDAPQDEIIWDTGHQAYTHKLLTGRFQNFETLRKYKGISGYPTPEESSYDTFPVGHAGTSISVGLGFCKARNLKHGTQKIISIIGDGAMTSGLALEALNNSSKTTQFIVILNDNEMSISKTQGAFSEHFSRLVTKKFYRTLKKHAGVLIPRIPLIGNFLANFILKLISKIKFILLPPNIFENLGFHYLGPIDGHDINQLLKVLAACPDDQKRPVLLHLVTQKGKGYVPAEKNPECFHGVSNFDHCNGIIKNGNELTYTMLFANCIKNFAEKDQRLMVVSAAMCGGIGMTEFAEIYPERFTDVGIAEQHAVTFAGGLAARGLRPIVGIYSTFLQRAYDQIEHDVCLANVPVIFALDRAGLVGSDGKTHHGIFDIAYLRHLPNMKIFMPRDMRAMEKIMEFCLKNQTPCAIRYPRSVVPHHIAELPEFNAAADCWETVRQGATLAILTIGQNVFYAYKAAEILKTKNIDCAVIDCCSIKPLDYNMLKQISEKPIVTFEDHVIAGGFGSSISEALVELQINQRVLHIGIPDKFVEHGTLEQLYEELGFLPEQLATRIETWYKKTVEK